MSHQTLQRRLNRLDPPKGDFAWVENLSDEELEQRLAELVEIMLAGIGGGDAQSGYERFRRHSGTDLPTDWQTYARSSSYEKSPELVDFIAQFGQGERAQ